MGRGGTLGQGQGLSCSGTAQQGWLSLGDLFISLTHLGASFAVGNSFRQFLVLPLLLTMVGTCHHLPALFSAQPPWWGRLRGQPTAGWGPPAFPARREPTWSRDLVEIHGKSLV